MSTRDEKAMSMMQTHDARRYRVYVDAELQRDFSEEFEALQWADEFEPKAQSMANEENEPMAIIVYDFDDEIQRVQLTPVATRRTNFVRLDRPRFDLAAELLATRGQLRRRK